MSEEEQATSEMELPIQERIDKLPRDCITCDLKECSKAAPSKRCSRCKCVYYCSQICQKKDWRKHKPDCSVGSLVMQEGGLVVEKPDEYADRTPANTDNCPICFTTEIQNPVILKVCRHQFCFACLNEWQQGVAAGFEQGSDATSCPVCRSRAEDIQKTAIEKAGVLARRALQLERKRNANSEEVQGIRREALQELDKVLPGTTQPHVQAMFTKAEILLDLKEYSSSIELVDQVIEIDNERHSKLNRATELLERAEQATKMGLVDLEAERELDELKEEMTSQAPPSRFKGEGPMRHINIFLVKARAYENMEQWDDATQLYLNLLEMPGFFEGSTPRQELSVIMGLSKCMFHLGMYSKSITYADAGLQINRHFPWVHKHLALSQKAQGNLKGAVETMNRVALYETPWDDYHREEVLQLYEQLKAELDAESS